MLARLITTTGEPLPALELATVPRVGEPFALEAAPTVWRVLRVHWPAIGSPEPAVELHLCRAV
jgi:hypothetical protein